MSDTKILSSWWIDRMGLRIDNELRPIVSDTVGKLDATAVSGPFGSPDSLAFGLIGVPLHAQYNHLRDHSKDVMQRATHSLDGMIGNLHTVAGIWRQAEAHNTLPNGGSTPTPPKPHQPPPKQSPPPVHHTPSPKPPPPPTSAPPTSAPPTSAPPTSPPPTSPPPTSAPPTSPPPTSPPPTSPPPTSPPPTSPPPTSAPPTSAPPTSAPPTPTSTGAPPTGSTTATA